MVQAGEEIMRESEKFKDGLRVMWEREGKGIIFIECATKLSSLPHTRIECFVVEKDLLVDLPLFLSQTLTEEVEGVYLSIYQIYQFHVIYIRILPCQIPTY